MSCCFLKKNICFAFDLQLQVRTCFDFYLSRFSYSIFGALGGEGGRGMSWAEAAVYDLHQFIFTCV